MKKPTSIVTVLKQVANRQLFEGQGLHFVPRGLTYPLDFGALGTVRFGKKAGETLPILTPDNSFTLAVDAVFRTDKLTLNAAPGWMEPDGFVYVGQRELHQIEDINGAEVYLTRPLLADQSANTPVYHYSNPVTVEGAYVEGQTIINVDSSHFLVRGDVLAFPVVSPSAITLSFIELQITDLSLVSLVSGIYQYQVTLSGGIPKDLEDGELIQLRAFLAYKSPILTVPFMPGLQRRVSGPFLVDWISAPFLNKMDFSETQTLFLYNTGRSLIEDPRVISKNEVILNVPIRADQFLFWQKVNGSINYDATERRFIMQADGNGHWRLKHTCGPHITTPIKNASGYIICVAPSQLNDNEGFTLDDSIDPIIFEYQTTNAYIPTPSAAATGSIWVNTLPTNNTYFELDDGYGQNIVVEFHAAGGFIPTPGRYVIDSTTAVITTDVSILIEQFIQNLTGFNLQATAVGPQVNFTNSSISTKGNTLIVLDPLLTGAGWVAAGMSGGTNEVVTIDVRTLTTNVEVAALTSTIINASRSKIRADFPLTWAVGLTTSIPGPSANIPVTETVLDPEFVVSGMSGGVGGFKWTFKIRPEADALLKVRFYPNAWQTFNLPAGIDTTVQVEIKSSDDPVQIIDLLLKTTAGTKAYMADWLISSPRVGFLAYEYVARLFSNYDFASTTVFAKQLFQSLDDVQAVHDVGLLYDGGVMRL